MISNGNKLGKWASTFLVIAVLMAADGVGRCAVPAQKPDGANIFASKCMLCHATGARAPQIEMLNKLSAEHIYDVLTKGAMQVQASSLSEAERHAVADYLGTKRTGDQDRGDRNPCPAQTAAQGSATWTAWSPDERNTRFQPAQAAGLTAAEVPSLTVRWAFIFPGANTAANQPTIADGRLYVGSWDGTVYALNAASGCSYWAFKADAGVRTAIVLAKDLGIFGDFKGTVYAVNLATGKLAWKTKVEEHSQARLTASPIVWRQRVYVPVSSLEEGTAADPKYECCTFRGSVVALDLADGKIAWKTHTIDREPKRTGTNKIGTAEFGPSGGSVWNSPTVDAKRGTLYFADGNNYSDPPDKDSDAVLAIDLATGKKKWSRQLHSNDAWNAGCMKGQDLANCPVENSPDYDFGSSPVLVTGVNGRDLVLAGQKSGMFYALDPDNGNLLWELRLGKGGSFGGIQWGFATDGKRAYVPISDRDVDSFDADGSMTAVDLSTGKLAWRTPDPANACSQHREFCSIAETAPATLIPGVAFSGSFDGHLRAYDTETGKILWDFDTDQAYQGVNHLSGHGGSLSGAGPTVADGMVYQTSGYAAFGLGMPGNVLLAFGLPDNKQASQVGTPHAKTN